MSLLINNRIWELAEKLYIHCYGVDGFVELLKSRAVSLPDNFYSNFEIYSFMSTEQNQFAQLMQRVPAYKYLSILNEVVFDKDGKVSSMQHDNWNYYGVYIKNWWYPELLKEITNVRLKIDAEKRRIEQSEDEDKEIQDGPDFLKYNFNDPFLEYIKKEINENYKDGRYLSVMILSRKLIECLIIRIFEVVFIKNNSDGTYNDHNHSLWFDKTKGRFHDLDRLLDNLKDSSTAFDEDKDLVEETCSLIKPLKNEMNKVVHRDYKSLMRKRLINEISLDWLTNWEDYIASTATLKSTVFRSTRTY